jgi:hypothetical protein
MSATVLTLDTAAFAAACSRLQACVAPHFRPDLVVGIRQGGACVSARLFDGVPHVEVTMRRPSTRGKSRVPRRLMRSFPYAVLDRLRLLEARWLNRRAPRPYPAGTVPAQVPTLPAAEALNILVVDDAVDSGRTLELVVRWLRTQRPRADIRAAVLTVTTRTPLLMPDYYLYYPDTLIRFPWSLDNKTP